MFSDFLSNLRQSNWSFQVGKLFGFLVAGLPAFFIAVLLNYFLVDHLRWYEPLAYAVVLIFQVTMNFFMCRIFVFKEWNDKSILQQFWQFVCGILALRVGDWVLYSFLVRTCGFYYLGVQFANILIFAVLKFKYTQKVIEE